MEKRGDVKLIVGIAVIMIVLVVVIWGVSDAWSNSSDKVEAFVPGNNIEVVQNACELACLQDDKVAFCEKKRELRLDKSKRVVGACVDFVDLGFSFFSVDDCGFSDCKGVGLICKSGFFNKVECSSLY